MFKASKTYFFLISSHLIIVFIFLLSAPDFIKGEEEKLAISYNWIPKFYGKLEGETKLLYTRSEFI